MKPLLKFNDMLPIILVSQSDPVADISQFKETYSIQPAWILHVRPEKGLLVEHMHDVHTFIHTDSRMNKMVILYDFHTAKADLQNSLLKTLEEENEHTLFVLVVNDELQVLPTIRSRSTVKHSRSTSADAIDMLEKYGCSLDSMTYPQWLSMTAKISKTDAQQFIDQLILKVRSNMLHMPSQRGNYPLLLHEMIRIRSYMQNNLNHEYAIDAIGYALQSHLLLQNSH